MEDLENRQVKRALMPICQRYQQSEARTRCMTTTQEASWRREENSRTADPLRPNAWAFLPVSMGNGVIFHKYICIPHQISKPSRGDKDSEQRENKGHADWTTCSVGGAETGK